MRGELLGYDVAGYIHGVHHKVRENADPQISRIVKRRAQNYARNKKRNRPIKVVVKGGEYGGLRKNGYDVTAFYFFQRAEYRGKNKPSKKSSSTIGAKKTSSIIKRIFTTKLS